MQNNWSSGFVSFIHPGTNRLYHDMQPKTQFLYR